MSSATSRKLTKVRSGPPQSVFLSLRSHHPKGDVRQYRLVVSYDKRLDGAQTIKGLRRIEKILPDIQRRVFFIDPVVFEWETTGSCELGAFPIGAKLSTPALTALYIAILAERQYVALQQIRWPENVSPIEFPLLERAARADDEAQSSLSDYLFPRYSDTFSPPYEPLPHLPRGLPVGLEACCYPIAPKSLQPPGKTSKVGLFCDWYMSNTFAPPVVAWTALSMAEMHLGRFSRAVERSAREQNEYRLLDVEFYPQVTASGHAALWLSALRDKRLIVGAPKWPRIYCDDVLYMTTFGNDATKGLVARYLNALPHDPSADPDRESAAINRNTGEP